MLTTTEARTRILASVRPLPAERVPLSSTGGRILRSPAVAERDQPPFDRATMDGIAVAADALEAGTREFKVAGVQAAGQPQAPDTRGHPARPNRARRMRASPAPSRMRAGRPA